MRRSPTPYSPGSSSQARRTHGDVVDEAAHADAGHEVGVDPGDGVLHGRQRRRLDAALHRLRQGVGLLEDLLLHVVVVPAL